MIEVRFAVLARRDFEAIESYYRSIDPDLAQHIGGRILAATRVLADLPRAGPATSRTDRRKWRIADTPYVLFYRIERDHLRVLRIVHSARRAAQP